MVSCKSLFSRFSTKCISINLISIKLISITIVSTILTGNLATRIESCKTNSTSFRAQEFAASCKCDDTGINCDKVQMTTIIDGMLPSGEHFKHFHKDMVMQLQNNRITYMKRSNFRGYDRCVQLDASNNIISEIEKGAFTDMKLLGKLDLSHNRITFLHKNAFEGLSDLTHLDLSHNLIESVTGPEFYGLARMEMLKLNDNHLLSVHRYAFKDNKNLRHLWLFKNSLTTAWPEWFTHTDLNSATNDDFEVDTAYFDQNRFDCNCDMIPLWNYLKTEKGKWAARDKTGFTSIECTFPHAAHELFLANLELKSKGGVLNDKCTPPKLLSKNSKIDVVIGTSAKLTCNITGNPLPAVRFELPKQLNNKHVSSGVLKPTHHSKSGLPYYQFKNEQLYEHQDHIREEGILELVNVTLAFSGKYFCYADGHPKIRHEFQVNVVMSKSGHRVLATILPIIILMGFAMIAHNKWDNIMRILRDFSGDYNRMAGANDVPYQPETPYQPPQLDQSTHVPYSPSTLTNDDLTEVDGLLTGHDGGASKEVYM